MKCCCADEGCETLHDNPHKICNQTSFNARCAESNSATNASDGVDWVVGTMVWTLFDYCACPLALPSLPATWHAQLCSPPSLAVHHGLASC